MSNNAIGSICVAVVFIAVIAGYCFIQWLDAKYGGEE